MPIAKLALRGNAMYYRGWLFGHSRVGGARRVHVPITQTRSANGVEPQAFLADVIEDC